MPSVKAERLAASGVIGTLASQEFDHNGNTYTEYLLCKRDSLIVVALPFAPDSIRGLDLKSAPGGSSPAPVRKHRKIPYFSRFISACCDAGIVLE